MLAAFTIASNALQVQSQKLEEIASSVAAPSPTSNGTDMRREITSSPVRIVSLPVGEEVDNMISLKEVELAYRMNAAVIATAAEMTDALLDAVHPEKR